jgi:hypothetical protein
MEHLPIKLKISRRDGDLVTATTKSGHEFSLPREATPTETEFQIDELKADDIDDATRIELARAVLNEIIGATPEK